MNNQNKVFRRPNLKNLSDSYFNDQLLIRQPSARWQILFVCFVIHVFIPTILCSFGVYIMYLEDSGLPISETILAPMVFLVIWIITRPWCHQISESWIENGRGIGRWIAVVSTVLLSIGIYLWEYNSIWRSILAGLLSGLGASFLLEFVKSFVNDQFQSHQLLIKVMQEAAVAIGQFIVPHMIYAYIRFYSLTNAPVLQCATVLQILPAVLLLRARHIGYPSNSSRYSDFQRPVALLTDLEMVDFSKRYHSFKTNENSKSTRSPPKDNNKLETFRQWKSLPNIATGNNENCYQNDANTEDEKPKTNVRHKNPFGVEILPEIPEENESILSETNNYNKNINRLSMMSTKLDEMISKQDAADIFTTNKEPTNTTVDNSECSNRKLCIQCLSPYKRYYIRKQFQKIQKVLYSWILKPLWKSLILVNFYLALLANITVYLGWISFICIVPTLNRIVDRSISSHESIFIISIAAFLWIAFLITTPWYSELPKRKIKYILVIGILIQGVAFYVLSDGANHETLTSGSIIFGLGFGAASFSIDISLKEMLGLRHWPIVEKTLYFFSSSIIFVFIYLMKETLKTYSGISSYLRVLCYLDLSVASLWGMAILIYKLWKFNSNTYNLWKSLDSMYL